MQVCAITLHGPFQHPIPGRSQETRTRLNLHAGLTRQRQDRRHDYTFIENQAPRLLVELDEVDGIVSHLLAVGGGQSGSLELHHDDHPVAQQHAVHAQAPSAEVELQQHVAIVGEVVGSQRLLQQRNLARAVSELFLEHADARTPLLMLFRLDMQALSRRVARQLADDGLDRVADEYLPHLDVPRRACAHTVSPFTGHRLAQVLPW